jgi:hypothetical protein
MGLLRRRGAFVWRGGDGALTIEGPPEAVARIAAAHARIDSPFFAPVLEQAEGRVVLGCDAATDFEEVVARLERGSKRVPYAVGIALNELLMDGVEAANAAGLCFGALCYANVVVGPGGEAWLVGVGHNFPAAAGAAGLSLAHEIALGMEATPASDVFALHALIRQLLVFAEPLPLFAEAMASNDERSRELHEVFLRLNQDLTAPDPRLRLQAVAELRARYRAIRALAGTMPPPDTEGLREELSVSAREIAGLPPPSSGRPRLPLVIDAEARDVRWGEAHVDLSRRRSLRLVLRALLSARQAQPGAPVDWQALLAEGWPGEQVQVEAGRARVYVAISTLRKLGFEELILRRDDGYLLDPRTPVSIVERH